ncbi:helix-turn-helix domain-containing protein [Nocardia tengchongensis]|uniref:Helix-turn-helix domain-containing protein n=2 Tax=Actinomycetes TaxID=1760 RepID=A0ABX8CGE8_9NOCA|nr:helix-turn-helix domain-containing protein [Nocardia tengchongensis]QVI19026.1 helix-turn-helix domain-containing protein [Nocardia tengchongensis]
MAVLLDAASCPIENRHDLVTDLAKSVALQVDAELLDPPERVVTRHEKWRLGVATLHRIQISAVRVRRTPAQVLRTPSSAVAVVLQKQAVRHHYQNGRHTVTAPGECAVWDFATPFEVGWDGLGESWCIAVPRDRLGLSSETLAAATGRLRHSPLHDMIAGQITELIEGAEALERDPAAVMVGQCCVEMVRALLLSASGPATTGDDTPAHQQAVVRDVQSYVRRHLNDPDLRVEQIAAAHNMSARYLYRLCAGAGIRLEQWIIGERLAAARALLVDPAHGGRTISAIAHTVGFRDATHFTRRFRAAYGMTPRDWRYAAATA